MQVSTKLKLGEMWNHNGTYMEGYGLQYRDHQVVIEITPEDELAGAHIAPPLSAAPVLGSVLPAQPGLATWLPVTCQSIGTTAVEHYEKSCGRL